MSKKAILMILVTLASLGAVFFMIRNNLELAIFCLTLMFTFSNYIRYAKSKEMNLEKEANWMKKMTIAMAILSVIVLVAVVI